MHEINTTKRYAAQSENPRLGIRKIRQLVFRTVGTRSLRFFLPWRQQCDWVEVRPDDRISPTEKFEVACVSMFPTGGTVTVELMAQPRPTGQILDSFRLAIKGPQIQTGHGVVDPSFKGRKQTATY
jgi:hypothetical protein